MLSLNTHTKFLNFERLIELKKKKKNFERVKYSTKYSDLSEDYNSK